MFDRLGPRQRTLAFFGLLALGCIGAVAGALMLADARLDLPAARPAFVSAGLMAGFAILGICALMWLIFDETVARPIERLAAAMHARAATDMRGGIDTTVARHLGDLSVPLSGPDCEEVANQPKYEAHEPKPQAEPDGGGQCAIGNGDGALHVCIEQGDQAIIRQRPDCVVLTGENSSSMVECFSSA
jgi:hypothetical protein